MDPETIAVEFDLDLADIYRAMAYYYDNIDEMSERREQRKRRIAESKDDQEPPESFREPV